MEGTTEHSGPIVKFGKMDSSGPTCVETLKSLYGDAQDVRNMGISTLKMLCH
jgi:hypothetical protein